MGFYAKVGTVVMRSFGLMIILYTIPVLIWGIVRIGSGAVVASDGNTPIRAAFLGWLFYGLAGVLVYASAKPFGRLTARGLDNEGSFPSAT
jgi:hypothetical protein